VQDYSEKANLLKQIAEGLDEIQKIEEEISILRIDLGNTTKRFRLHLRSGVTNAPLIAFRQRLGRLSHSYIDIDDKVYELMKIVDKIQP
jgi:hypothetical protein